MLEHYSTWSGYCGIGQFWRRINHNRPFWRKPRARKSRLYRFMSFLWTLSTRALIRRDGALRRLPRHCRTAKHDCWAQGVPRRRPEPLDQQVKSLRCGAFPKVVRSTAAKARLRKRVCGRRTLERIRAIPVSMQPRDRDMTCGRYFSVLILARVRECVIRRINWKVRVS